MWMCTYDYDYVTEKAIGKLHKGGTAAATDYKYPSCSVSAFVADFGILEEPRSQKLAKQSGQVLTEQVLSSSPEHEIMELMRWDDMVYFVITWSRSAIFRE